MKSCVNENLIGKKVYCNALFDVFAENCLDGSNTIVGEIIDTFEDKHMQGYVIKWECERIEQVYKNLLHEEKVCGGVGIYYKN